jgi:gas vesicle protein
MKTMAKKKKSSHTLSAGLIGAALGAAGAWFLYATETGKEKREELVKLADKVKDEVAEEIQKVKAKGEPAVHSAIETVVEKYKAVKSIDPAVLGKIADDLKKRWNEVKEQFDSGDSTEAPVKEDSDSEKKV